MDENFGQESMGITPQEGMPQQGCSLQTGEMPQQESNFQAEELTQPEGKKRKKKRPRKKPGFGIGVLVGILSMFVVLAVIVTVALGVIRNVGLNIIIGIKENGSENSQEDENTNGNTSTDINENVLNADLLSQVSMIEAYLEQYFLYEVDKEALREGMLQGLLWALEDPYSQYFNEEELASFNDSTQGEYVGIGAAVTQELSTGIVRISKPYEGTPSAEAGLLPGDIIVSVEDTEVTGMDLTQVVSLIKGEEGTSVTLHIYREDEEEYLDIEVTRRTVELPTVTSEMLEGNIGYIEVTSFDGVTANQFISAFEALKAQGMESVIVDMRNNGGGLVDTVEEMLDYLLPEGTIFYVKDKSGTKSMEYASDASAALDIPMVVLVNGNTASAAEVFAGNIQEFGLGTVVGTTTYGKGVMQQLFYTNAKGTAAVKLTVADYYIHNDKNVNGTGIEPDVVIELDEEAAKMIEIPIEQDNQLQKALEVLE